MTIEAANRLIVTSMMEIYDEREAAAISSLVMERLTGMPKSKRVLHKLDELSVRQEESFQYYLEELIRQRPVQYVLGEAWFGSLPFYVDENVLIPRPETEELAAWLLCESIGRAPGISILDIGTGSGCIPVYIKKKRLDFRVMAMDISEAALDIAKKNSAVHNAKIEFLLSDINERDQWERIPSQDLIISNPPYIPLRQRAVLEKHVRDFEPALALFVPDNDPIRFYKTIGEFAKKKLNPEGIVFLEIHHDFAKDIMEWFRAAGFELELKKDFSGNNRMIKAWMI